MEFVPVLVPARRISVRRPLPKRLLARAFGAPRGNRTPNPLIKEKDHLTRCANMRSKRVVYERKWSN
jgi:hypothetical protein